jgi:hypothetical protein
MAKPNDPSDELQIRNLIARLAQAADLVAEDRLDADYVPLFTEDAVWEAVPGALAPGAIRNEGIAAIRAAAVERRRVGTSGPDAGLMHMVSTSVIAIDGDVATAQSCSIVVHGAEQAIRSLCRYDDLFRRTGDEWRLARRTVRPC